MNSYASDTVMENTAANPDNAVMRVRKVDRDVSYDFDTDIPRYWMNENVWATHLANSFHLIFPDGERFFIRSVAAYKDRITEPELRAQVKDFMAQEVQHGIMHEKFQATLRKQGFKIDGFLKFYNWLGYGFIEKWSNRIFGPRIALSITAALEHYTASLAEVTLTEDFDHMAPPAMVNMLRWHACEEIEHKSVAFNVLKQVAPGYFLRVFGLFAATFLLAAMTLIGQWSFILQDGQPGLRGYARALLHFLRNGARMHRNIPGYVLQYLKPDFHPDQIDNRHIAARYLLEQGLEPASA